MNLRLIVLGLALCLGCAAPAFAQQLWEGKPARILVPYGPGSGPDALARDLADRLSKQTGKTLVVINRPGANGNIGIDAVAKSAPDGFTLLLVDPLNFIVNPLVYGVSPYDWKTELKPVSSIADVSLFLFASTQKRFSTVADLIDFARANPGKYFYGATSSPTLLATELLNNLAGVQTVRVPFKGASPAFTAVMAGDVQLVISGIGTLLPLARGGKVKGLAVTGLRRSALAPEIPTVDESGVSGYSATTWYGLAAPGATPRPIVDRINAEMHKLLAEPEIRAQLRVQGVDEPRPGTPEQLMELVRSELVKWERVVKSSGAKAE